MCDHKGTCTIDFVLRLIEIRHCHVQDLKRIPAAQNQYYRYYVEYVDNVYGKF